MSNFSLNEADLSSLFQPAWTRESDKYLSQFQHENKEKKETEDIGRRNTFRNKKRRNPESRKPFIKKKESSHGDADLKIKTDLHYLSKDSGVSLMSTWEIEVIPEPRALNDIVKHIRFEMKAYPLFDIARLILSKPERYQLKMHQASQEHKKPLFQCVIDETVWFNEEEAVKHLLKKQRHHYYRSQTISIDPPKGSYTSIGVCGMSGVLLGPPNYHEYQTNIQELHKERFSNIPLEVFKKRIQMKHDEELLARWKEERSHREEFVPLNVKEGEEPFKLSSLRELENHFCRTHASLEINVISDEVIFSHAEAWKNSHPKVCSLIEEKLKKQQAFPLALSHKLSQELDARGLQIFKAHENIVYASLARPRVLNRIETPISPQLNSILEALETHVQIPRADQWKAILTSYPVLEGETVSESTVAKELSWLLHEGYVINFAKRGFEIPKEKVKK